MPPTTAILGAFHIATRYLKLPLRDVEREILTMLETRSPAFYLYIPLEDTISAIEYATYYKVKSWDGYIITLAKNWNNIIYTLDKELKKIKDILAINPFPKDIVEEYYEYIKSRRKL
ncbi:MAG: hypothetical protein NO483_02790 [Candidatus Methanomethylicia archaeon]|nr:hypothetical protein [Candidatus Methanomethylicia archaeon]